MKFVGVAFLSTVLLFSSGCTLQSSNKLSISVVVPGPPPRQVGFESASGTPWRAMNQPHSRSTVVNGCFFANVLTAEQKRTIDANGGNCWQRGELSAPKIRHTADSFAINMEATSGRNRLVEVLRLFRPDGSDDDCTGSVADRLRAGAVVQSYGYGTGDFFLGSSVDVYPSTSPQTVTENCAIDGTAANTYPVLFVLDSLNYRVRAISATTVTTIAGDGSHTTPVADGLAATAGSLGEVQWMTQDSSGNIYLNQTYAGSRGVRKIGTDGIIHTIASTGTTIVHGIATDGTTLYFSEGDCILSIPIGGETATDIEGVCGSPGTTYPTALGSTSGSGFGVSNVQGLAYANNSLFFTDTTTARISRMDFSSSKTFRVAGINGSPGAFNAPDGQMGDNTQLQTPTALAADSSGNVYFTDPGQARVRKADASASHIVSTLAGPTVAVNNIGGVAAANNGTAYYTETSKCLIHAIDTQNNVTIYAGTDSVITPLNDNMDVASAHFYYPATLYYGFLNF